MMSSKMASPNRGRRGGGAPPPVSAPHHHPIDQYGAMDTSSPQQQQQRKEIYTYDAPWTVFSLAWSNRCVDLRRRRRRRRRPAGRLVVVVCLPTAFGYERMISHDKCALTSLMP